MKQVKPILLIFMIGLVLASCKTSTYLNVMRPADITLPGHVKTMAIVNRTKPEKGGGNQLLNILEGVVTGEGIFMDREGADRTLTGVTDIMLKTPRFEMTKPSMELERRGTDRFPEPLAWEEVEKICQESGSEALITLEILDSDHLLDTKKEEKTVKLEGGGTKKVIEFKASDKCIIRSGWRIYDPKNKKILDEFRSDDFRMFYARGKTPEAAIAALIARREMVNRTGFYAGQQYGYRIAPMPVRVRRMFYNGGSPEMKIAKRNAETNDWDGAAEIWKKEAETNIKRKVKGKAAYNMALAAEVQGNLDLAIMWARKSYQDYNNKKARYYVNTLERRKRDEEKLKEQMKDAGA